MLMKAALADSKSHATRIRRKVSKVTVGPMYGLRPKECHMHILLWIKMASLPHSRKQFKSERSEVIDA